MKVKQLIKKLSELDPEADVVVAENRLQVFAVRYAHPGTYLKKNKFFVLKDWIESGDQKYLTTVFGQDVSTMTTNAVMLSSWNGKFGDD